MSDHICKRCEVTMHGKSGSGDGHAANSSGSAPAKEHSGASTHHNKSRKVLVPIKTWGCGGFLGPCARRAARQGWGPCAGIASDTRWW